jgi:hypothetical protein
MKCGNRSADEEAQYKRNKEITKQIKLDAKINNRIAKLLLLGQFFPYSICEFLKIVLFYAILFTF